MCPDLILSSWVWHLAVFEFLAIFEHPCSILSHAISNPTCYLCSSVFYLTIGNSQSIAANKLKSWLHCNARHLVGRWRYRTPPPPPLRQFCVSLSLDDWLTRPRTLELELRVLLMPHPNTRLRIYFECQQRARSQTPPLFCAVLCSAMSHLAKCVSWNAWLWSDDSWPSSRQVAWQGWRTRTEIGRERFHLNSPKGGREREGQVRDTTRV